MPPSHEKILIFEPHPDDAAFQLGGTLCKWLAEEKEVVLCTVTAGGASTFDPTMDRERTEAMMMAEHARALDEAGLPAAWRVQWSYDDLGMDPHADWARLYEDALALIRRVRPVTVVTMDPKNRHNEENPDHRIVAEAGFDAAAMAACPNVHRDQMTRGGLRPHFVSRVLFYMSPEPDCFIDIDGEPLEAKIRMGLAYASQLELLRHEARARLAGLGVEVPLFDMPEEQLWPLLCRRIAEETAQTANALRPGGPELKAAEAFRLQYLGVVHKLKDFLPETLRDF